VARNTGDRIRRWLESGERLTWRLAAKLLFLAVLLTLAFISIAVNIWLVAFLSAGIATLMLRAVLPNQRFQAWIRDWWTGEAGDRWRRRFERTVSRVRGWIPL
jgi:hypothetical protein